MIVTIFGATGMTGTQLVKQALFLGHTVKAFGRNVFNTNFPRNENLELIQGALFDEEQVRHAVRGSDAVLSALGGSFDGTDKSRSLGIKNIIKQMQKEGIQRIIAIGGMGILDAPAGGLLMEDPDFPAEYLPVSLEHFKAYEYLKNSSLNWTMVGAPDLVNAEASGTYKKAANNNPADSTLRINTGDLALFILSELQKNEYLKKRVGISN